MNICIFDGHIGRDPSINTINGENVLNFSFAVATGSKQNPSTMWIECAIWGKRAESLRPYLHKGDKITVSGTLTLNEYKKKDGSGMDKGLRLSVGEITLPARDKQQGNQPAPVGNGLPAQSSAFQDEDIPF